MSLSVRDRSDEFQRTVDTYKDQMLTTTLTLPETPSQLKTGVVEASTRIHHQATNLVQQISVTSDKIQQLVDLAKSTSNFRDERPKIQRLMLDIKQDVERFDDDLKSIGSFIKHSFVISEINSDNCAHHHYNLLNILQTKYSDLAKTFALSCQISTESLQKQKEERDRYGGMTNKSFRHVPRNRLQKPRRTEVGNEEENQSLVSEDRDKHAIVIATPQQQSQAIAEVENEYHESRAMEAQYVETQLTEVAQMMTQLAEYVESQRHAIVRINVNTEEAIEHVEGAIEQLQKYLASLSGNRWLIIKIFAILIIFAVIFTVFIA